MVLIVDSSSKRRKDELRKRFLAEQIPCAVVNMDGLRKMPTSKITIVYAENENQLSIASIRSGNTFFTVINETGKRMINPDAHFYSEETDGDIVGFVKNKLSEKLSSDYDNLKILPIEFDGDNFLFRNQYVILTEKEKLLVRFLITGKDEYHTADEISRYIDTKSESIPQHVRNINKKTTEATERKLILAKRGFGYTVDTSVGEISEPTHYNVNSPLPRFV